MTVETLYSVSLNPKGCLIRCLDSFPVQEPSLLWTKADLLYSRVAARMEDCSRLY